MRFAPLAKQNIRASRLCAWTQERLFAYVDGDLQRAEREAVQQHLDACPNCQMELMQARRSEEALVSAPLTLPAPGDLRAGFYAKLAAAEAARAPRRFGGQWKAALSACAVTLLAVVVWRSVPTSPSVSVLEPVPPEASRAIASRGDAEGESLVLKDQPALAGDALAKSRPQKNETFQAEAVDIPTMAARESRANSEAKSRFLAGKSAASPREAAALNKRVAGMDRALKKQAHRLSGASVAAVGKASDFPTPSADTSLDARTARNLGIDSLTQMRGAEKREDAHVLSLFAARTQDATLKDESHFYAFGANTRFHEAGEPALSTGYVVASSVPEEGDITLEVHDEVRGFQASARYANYTEIRDDGEILTLEAKETMHDAEPDSSLP